MERKKVIKVVTIILISFILLLIICNELKSHPKTIIEIEKTTTQKDIESKKIQFKLPSLNLVSSNPISIDSDDDFITYGFPGLGTAEDPYVIENYNITTTNTYGISIIYTSGSTKHYIIRNCYIDASDFGIYILYPVTTNSVDNITNNICINNNWQGVYLRGCHNSIISNNICINNKGGISFYQSSMLTIKNNVCMGSGISGTGIDVSIPIVSGLIAVVNNTCKNFEYCGIDIDNRGYKLRVENNTCENNGRDGIKVHGTSDQATVSNNTCSNNAGTGIIMDGSNQSVASNNTCNNNTNNGIHFWGSCSIIANNCNNNSMSGIMVEGDSHLVLNNSCTNNTNGIKLYGSHYSTLVNNTCINNRNGIYLFHFSSSSIIINNTFTNDGLRIEYNSFENNTIENNFVNNKILGYYQGFENTIINDSIYGQIFFVNCRGVTVRDVDISNSTVGLSFFSCENATIVNNTFINNYNGAELINSSWSTVMNNNCSYNENYGIYFSSSTICSNVTNNINNNNRVGIELLSDNSTVTNNTCNNNDIGIYLYFSDNSVINNNTCYNNVYGMCIEFSDSNMLFFNLIVYNEEYGIHLFSNSENNNIHHNIFINNNLLNIIQVKDDGINNIWFGSLTLEGNYWSDWDGTSSYSIEGSASSVDPYPLNDTDLDYLNDSEEYLFYGTNPFMRDTDGDSLPDGYEVMYGLNPLKDDGDEDLDNDGLTNFQEFIYGTEPNNNDTDSDSLPDLWELQTGTNATLTDNNEDLDGDTLTNYQEYILGTLANNTDTDGDGMEDGYEVQYTLDPLIDDSTLDLDGDGLTNLQEFNYGTYPNNNDTDSDGLLDYDEIYVYYTNAINPDTDSDGLLDGDEVHNIGSNPLVADTDEDGLSDGKEVNEYLTNPINSDTDSDQMNDGWEVETGTNPLVDDSADDLDSDNLTNYQEYILGTLANSTDTDGDGMEDGYEVQYNLDPLIDDSTLDLDGDGLTNLQEFNYNTDPTNPDTDGDGLLDGEEVHDYLTNPTNPDTDGDGETDGQEVENGYNPLDSKSNFDNEKRAKILTILVSVISTIIVIGGVIGMVFYWRYRMKKITSSLGFSSVKEMKESRSKGFETKEEWEKAQKLGFDSYDEVKLAQSFDVKDKKALVSVVYLEIEDLALQIRSYEKRIRNYSELVPLEFEIENLERTENEITEIEKMLSSIVYTINTYKIVDDEKIKDIMYGVPEVGSTILKIDIPQIYEDISNRKEYLSIFNKMVNLTKQFHPNVPINIDRIAALAEVSQEKAIKYLKDITNEMPEIGLYLELEQVFIRQYSEDKEIGLFYEKFKEKYQERIIQEKTQPACLFCSTEFGEIDQTEKLICKKCGKEALTCPICKQNLLLKDEIVREKNCGTLFHRSHITMWIRSENLCPICKKRINEQSLEPYEA